LGDDRSDVSTTAGDRCGRQPEAGRPEVSGPVPARPGCPTRPPA